MQLQGNNGPIMFRFFLMSALVLAAGCELAVDFDRSRIVDGGDAGSDAALPDAGSDAAVDVGSDAATDAGDDAAVDAGDAAMDAGDAAMDAGSDAAMDAGSDTGVDAAVDAGVDAGDAGCSGPADCDDMDDCTMDVCDGVGACTNTPICSVTVAATIALTDLSTIVTIPEVDAALDGFVVVHADSAGSPGAILGSAPVAAGVSTNVDVELTRPVADAEVLHAMLHVDAGTIGTFEPGTDPAATLMGAIVVEMFSASVAVGVPAIEVTVTGNGADYVFSAPRPSTLALPAGSDPAIVLIRDYRYRVINTTPTGHPFELIDDGATVGAPADDVVELSQSAAGALEADVDVAWSDDGATSLFTASASFEAVINAYRCSIHTATMRAAVTFTDP